MEGEGAWPDRGSAAFLLRRLERTFPFWSIRATFAATDFLGALAMAANITFPLWVIFGNIDPYRCHLFMVQRNLREPHWRR